MPSIAADHRRIDSAAPRGLMGACGRKPASLLLLLLALLLLP
jgi:hypothetical protein